MALWLYDHTFINNELYGSMLYGSTALWLYDQIFLDNELYGST